MYTHIYIYMSVYVIIHCASINCLIDWLVVSMHRVGTKGHIRGENFFIFYSTIALT